MHVNENDVYIFEEMLSVVLEKLVSYLHPSSAKFAPRERREEDIIDCISQSNQIISLGWSGQRNNASIIQEA